MASRHSRIAREQQAGRCVRELSGLDARPVVLCPELFNPALDLVPRDEGLVTDAEIEREFVAYVEVVLRIEEVHVLVDLEGRIRILLVSRWKTQQQVGKRILPAIVHARESSGEHELPEQ